MYELGSTAAIIDIKPGHLSIFAKIKIKDLNTMVIYYGYLLLIKMICILL